MGFHQVEKSQQSVAAYPVVLPNAVRQLAFPWEAERFEFFFQHTVERRQFVLQPGAQDFLSIVFGTDRVHKIAMRPVGKVVHIQFVYFRLHTSFVFIGKSFARYN